jgi:protein-tyrosine phosphatase
MNRLLFLCTGNYYRSRFSEILFNSVASGSQLPWRAESRGLALDIAGYNIGPMSDDALVRLTAKGIHCSSMERFPQSAQESDFQAAHLIIALDEEEHRPMMRERFPAWEDKIEYWLVHDLDQWEAEITLITIERNVSQLVMKLRGNAQRLVKSP